MKGMEIRVWLALGLVAGFLLATFSGAIVIPDRFSALTNIVMVVIGFYFGNKATLDKPGE